MCRALIWISRVCATKEKNGNIIIATSQKCKRDNNNDMRRHEPLLGSLVFNGKSSEVLHTTSTSRVPVFK